MEPRQTEEPSVSLEQLRKLLLQPDRREIQEIKRQVEDRTIDVGNLSDALPDAVAKSAKSDHKLAKALTPPVEEALHESIRRNPQSLAELLFPVIGPAIRRAIANALRSMQESMNQTLEKTLSVDSFRWRMEAARTGRPYAEVVMTHTLQYRVTHVFLIHAESGLLLDHVAASEEPEVEPELISSMLRAILSFARESFGREEKDEIDLMQIGAFNIVVENGPKAIIAATVQGYPSLALRTTMADALETVHIEHRDALLSFGGDSSPFATTRPLLQSCLVQERKTRQRRSVSEHERRKLVVAAALLLLFLAPALWYLRMNSQWIDFRDALYREPGVTVLASGRQGLGYYVRGLRDPLSRDTHILRENAGLAADRVEEHWESYPSSAPPFVFSRARRLLNPPDSVRLALENGVLYPLGEVDHAWLTAARKLEPILPGGVILSFERTVDRDRKRVADILAALPARLYFSSGTALTEQSRRDLTQMASRLSELGAAAERAALQVQFVVAGDTDRLGTPEANRDLRRRRAETVVRELVRRGVPEGLFQVTVPAESPAQERSVQFLPRVVDPETTRAARS